MKSQQAQPGLHVPIIVLAAACDAAAWAAEIEATGYVDKPFEEEPLCREECYRQPHDAMGRRLGPAEAQGV